MDKRALDRQIASAVTKCTKCRLSKTRTKAVCGQGNLDTKIIFIGEAPGKNEDLQGKPFVGRAGNLLERLLGLIGFSREDVWIGNVIKCRPPGNRDPMVDELRSCTPYLDEQIKLINPKVIVTLGRFATQYFRKDLKISTAHGKPTLWKNKILYPVYHPAAALRNTSVLVILEKEFKRIPKVLEIDLKDLSESVAEGQEKGPLDQISLF